MIRRILTLFIVCLTVTHSLIAQQQKKRFEDPVFIHRSIKQLTDIMVYDIYSPPVASRTYAYITIAGYEAALEKSSRYLSVAGQLKGLETLPAPSSRHFSPTLAAVKAILTVGRALVISEVRIDTFYNSLLKEFRAAGMNEEMIVNSVSHGDTVAKAVLAWSSRDNYKETRTFSRYAVSNDQETWKPTPPAYMKAVEPHWNKMRTFILDSARQFQPSPPPAFSTDSSSEFYREAYSVYQATRELTADQRFIANFWDCNPYKMNVNGHVMFASKKISPGGHWINITGHACQKARAGTLESLHTYARVAIALADAFISCWDEKYRSNVIRPETYINQYIDPAWMPALQTPPFPEYTSGHSIVSAAASTILTDAFGDNFAYSDSTEMEFGIPPRHFRSFADAAQEAAISRFYGGIHYMRAIDVGSVEGKKIGELVIRRLKTKKK